MYHTYDINYCTYESRLFLLVPVRFLQAATQQATTINKGTQHNKNNKNNNVHHVTWCPRCPTSESFCVSACRRAAITKARMSCWFRGSLSRVENVCMEDPRPLDAAPPPRPPPRPAPRDEGLVPPPPLWPPNPPPPTCCLPRIQSCVFSLLLLLWTVDRERVYRAVSNWCNGSIYTRTTSYKKAVFCRAVSDMKKPAIYTVSRTRYMMWSYTRRTTRSAKRVGWVGGRDGTT